MPASLIGKFFNVLLIFANSPAEESVKVIKNAFYERLVCFRVLRIGISSTGFQEKQKQQV